MDITSADIQNWILSQSDDSELRLIQDVIALKLRLNFKLGDKVKFDGKTRGIIHGTISKMNAKSFKVLTTTGVTWTVSPQLLEKDT